MITLSMVRRLGPRSSYLPESEFCNESLKNRAERRKCRGELCQSVFRRDCIFTSARRGRRIHIAGFVLEGCTAGERTVRTGARLADARARGTEGNGPRA